MTIYFITGNKNKFEEARSILEEIEQVEVDLPEIQEIDARKIIEKKLLEALKHKQGEFIVEDTSLYIEGLNGLPGPLIKWFLKTIGNHGLHSLIENIENKNAEAKTIIGYARSPKEIYFFEGSIKGKIIKPSGESGFGWDPLFLPEGFQKSFAQMSNEEKNQISMRKKALERLREFLKD